MSKAWQSGKRRVSPAHACSPPRTRGRGGGGGGGGGGAAGGGWGGKASSGLGRRFDSLHGLVDASISPVRIDIILNGIKRNRVNCDTLPATS
jgi:hypothetical protein